MVVKEEDLNLSATEFKYFLECPQKFRIYRLLNPLPKKDDFMNNRRTVSSYKLRGYKGRKEKGIEYHAFFESFHRDYGKIIHETIPSEEICKDNVKLLFWTEQQKKYLEAEEDCYWYPVETEVRLMTEKKRGQIDRLELCENKHGYRIIDYKPTPDLNDHLLLLFYASLLNEYNQENCDERQYDYDIQEIGCYYYELGTSKIFNVTEKDNAFLEKIFTNSLVEIYRNEFYLKKKSCWGCDFKSICRTEVHRHVFG